VQHALRAFTPRDQKAVKSAAETMRAKPGLDIGTAITELGVGEALVSFLDEKGRPSITERVFVVPPGSQIGPISPAQRQQLQQTSLVAGVYEKAVDRESAYEKLKGRAATGGAAGGDAAGGLAAEATRATQGGAADAAQGAAEEAGGGLMGGLNDLLFGTTGPRGAKHDGLAQMMAKSAVRTVGTAVGREIIRGVLGSILGGSATKRRR
jgi:hypothetical protein